MIRSSSTTSGIPSKSKSSCKLSRITSKARATRHCLSLTASLHPHFQGPDQAHTFVGSFPEKAPPPWAPHPPYVSMMIFLPVRPASPWGPPMTKRPEGFRWKMVLSSKYLAGMTGLMTCLEEVKAGRNTILG